jgi:ubiquinone/menaquinone biosynthesis C-methylase UbiE
VIDLRQIEDARAWAETANVKRPWRIEFFAAMVEELRSLRQPSPSVLELGSGPGYLAETVLRALPVVRYTLLDFSPAMQTMATTRLGSLPGVQFVTADFRNDAWENALGPFDAVLTMQAVHELRDKSRAVGLHEAAYRRLRAGGLYLVCDHVLGPGGMTNSELYMTTSEQTNALRASGFKDVSVVLEKRGLVLHRGYTAA